MLTVLHTESSKGWGGQENRIIKESIGLKKLGARMIVLCQPDSTLAKTAAAEGIEVRTCRMRKHYDLTAVAYIMKLIKTESIDVINTHSGRDSFLAGVAGRLSSGKPAIVRTRHITMPLTSRVTYSILPHRVVTTSEYVRQYLISEGVKPDKVVTVETGINFETFDPARTEATLRNELGLGDEVPLIGTVAILRFKKGHHVLLDAIPIILKQVPEAVFVFAGDGPQRENITNRINSMGLSKKVLLLGMRKDIPNILKSIDVFVLPTLQEAHGGVFVEAMAMEKPVVGTAVGGVGYVIKDGLNGYLVAPDDSSALADAVIRTLSNREKAKTMGIEGRRFAEKEFTVERMCERMYGLYESLLKRCNR